MTPTRRADSAGRHEGASGSWLGSWGIKAKLLLLILGTSTGVLLLSALTFGAYQIRTSRMSLEGEMATLAAVVGDNLVAAIVFEDEVEANRILSSLAADAAVVSAAAYAASGRPVARFSGNERPSSGRERDPGSTLPVRYPIVFDGDTIGALELEADLSVRSQVEAHVFISILVLLGCALVAFLLANRLQHLVSAPIDALAEAATRVSQDADLTVRVDVQSDDQIGVLADAFNYMLGRIQEQVDELKSLATAVDESPVTILVTDRDGTIQFANPAFEEMTGWRPEEAAGQRADFARQSELQPQANNDVWEVISSGMSWTGCVTGRHRNGDALEEHATISPIYDECGEISRFVAVLRDVGEERALEAERATHQKLESIGQLAAGIAHEINTPTQYVGDNVRFFRDSFSQLVPLMRGLEALADEHGDEVVSDAALDSMRAAIEQADLAYLLDEIPRAIDESLEGVDRVARIVSAMKDFSHVSPEKAPTDINAAIPTTVTVASNEWRYVAEMEMDLDESLPLINCVPGELNQVILNLVVNAAHAIAEAQPEGGGDPGRITVRTRAVGAFIEIQVSDTGRGMTREVKERIFDPFYTTKEPGKGTGQGLSIVHSVVVVKHGGSIDVRSEVGQGTTFTVRLPIEDSSDGWAAV